MHWWVTDYIEAGLHVLLISHIFWLIFSITLHELAHGWAAIWQGDDTPRRYGHMTASPLIHMGPQSLIMLAVLGIAWGQMPIDPSRFRWRRAGRIVVAGAGPAMNVALAVVSLTALALIPFWGSSNADLTVNIATFLWVGGWLNLTLAVFNLLPLWPLDGAQMLMGTSFGWYRFFNSEKVQMVSYFIFFVIFLSGLGFFAFALAQIISENFLLALAGVFGINPAWQALGLA